MRIERTICDFCNKEIKKENAFYLEVFRRKGSSRPRILIKDICKICLNRLEKGIIKG